MSLSANLATLRPKCGTLDNFRLSALSLYQLATQHDTGRSDLYPQLVENGKIWDFLTSVFKTFWVDEQNALKITLTSD